MKRIKTKGVSDSRQSSFHDTQLDNKEKTKEKLKNNYLIMSNAKSKTEYEAGKEIFELSKKEYIKKYGKAEWEDHYGHDDWTQFADEVRKRKHAKGD